MSQSEEIYGRWPKKRAVERFMPDAAGRMIFYPSGPRRRGYVTGNTRRQRELRDWYERRTRMERRASLLIVPVVLALLHHFCSESRWIAGTAVTLAPIILDQLWYNRAVRRIVIGLESAPPASRAGRRVLRIPPLGIPLGFVALWVPLASWMHLTYAPDRIPLAAGTNVAFYTNIS